MKFLIGGLKKELSARKITLADEIYIAEKYPDYAERLKETSPDMRMICDIVYRLLEDRTPFQMIQVTEIDENGLEVTRNIGGVELFAAHCVTDVDKLTVLNVFIDACNKSRPDAQKGVKKKMSRLRSLIIGALFTILPLLIIGSLVRYLL